MFQSKQATQDQKCQVWKRWQKLFQRWFQRTSVPFFEFTFWLHFGHILVIFWSHFGHILVTFWGHILVTFWGHILVTFSSNSRHILITFQLHFCHILVTFWSRFGHILVTFWSHFGHNLGTFWSHFGRNLVTFWSHFSHSHFGHILSHSKGLTFILSIQFIEIRQPSCKFPWSFWAYLEVSFASRVFSDFSPAMHMEWGTPLLLLLKLKLGAHSV